MVVKASSTAPAKRGVRIGAAVEKQGSFAIANATVVCHSVINDNFSKLSFTSILLFVHPVL